MRFRFLLISTLFIGILPLELFSQRDYDRSIDSVKAIIDTTQFDSTKYTTVNQWAALGRAKYGEMKEWAENIEPELVVLMDSAQNYFRRKRDTTNLRNSLAHIATYRIQVPDSMGNPALEEFRYMGGIYGYELRNTHLKPDSSGEYLFFTIRNNFLMLEDSSKDLSFDEILAPDIQQKFEGNFTIPYGFDKNPKDRVFWLKMKVRSTNFRDDDYHFEIGKEAQSWRKIDIYIQDSLDSYSHFISGNDVAPKDKMIKDWRNKFKIYVPEKGTRYLYLRLEHPARILTPTNMFLAQINPLKIMQDEMRTWQVNGVFFGIVFIQAIFFVFLFFTSKIRYYLYYIIFLISLALMMIVTNYLTFILPAYVEYLMVFNIILGTSSTIGLLYFAFDFLQIEQLNKRWKYFLQGFSLIFLGSNALMIRNIFNSAEYFFTHGEGADIQNSISFSTAQVLIALGIMVLWGFKAHFNGHKTARYLLIGMGIMLFGIGIPLLSPILQVDWIGFEEAIISSQVSIMFLLAFFALAIGQQRRELEIERRNALEEKLKLQEEINAASAKFVPFDFIRSLGKQNILDVRLGDATEKEVTVFFSDIRDYTSLVEHMSPEENFRFINDFHRTIGPSISNHKGFVNQYLGDGIMAVFLESQDHALQAAIEIQSQIRQYTPLIPDRSDVSLRLGMGLHAGNLIMGIIGDDKRTDAATVSDTVNTASRMEGLTKYYGAPILLSGEVKDRLENEEEYALRYLGKVQVKGKQNHVEVYESLKGRAEKEEEVFVRFMQEFHIGVNAYFSKDFKAARDAFEQIISFNPSDKAAKLFYQNSLSIIEQGTPENWDGSLRMHGK